MGRKTLTAIIVLNVLGTLGAIVWAVIWINYAGLALTDTNLEAFLFKLSPEQGQGITLMAGAILRSAVVPLLVTNCLWLAILAARWMMADVVEPSLKHTVPGTID